MSDLQREDLRLRRVDRKWEYDHVSDEQFDKLARAEGYVKLDVDKLDELLSEWFNMEIDLVSGWTTDVKVLRQDIARQVLAALDGEGDMRRLCNHCGSTGVVSCEPSPCGHGGHPCERCDGSGLIDGEDT